MCNSGSRCSDYTVVILGLSVTPLPVAETGVALR